VWSPTLTEKSIAVDSGSNLVNGKATSTSMAGALSVMNAIAKGVKWCADMSEVFKVVIQLTIIIDDIWIIDNIVLINT
jgi:hypothetical protein